MTASLHKLGPGSTAGLYYTNDSVREARPNRRDEYYVSGGEGVWWSSGQSLVAHGAPIDVGSFRDLCSGRHPGTGASLVRGAGDTHWAGLDITLTPGKSVSVLWAAGTEEQREAIEAAHHAAVDRALRFILDEKLVLVRRGAGGRQQAVPSDLIVGRFTHFTTREGDPNLHTHSVVMNVAAPPPDNSGRRYGMTHLTIEPDRVFKWQLTVGAVYRSALAEIIAGLELKVRPAGRGQWEVDGLPQELLNTFSKRAKQIEERVGSTATAAQKEIAALATRRTKDEVPTGIALEKRWHQELAATRIDPWQASRNPKLESGHDLGTTIEREQQLCDGPEVPGTKPVALAASALFRHDNVLTRKSLLEKAFVEAALQQLGPDSVYRDLATLESDGTLLRLNADCWTTPSIAACEAALLRAADRPQAQTWVRPDALEEALGRAPHLSDEQRNAIRQASNHDGITILEAGAGTGKTTLARTLVEAARASGLSIVGLAPSWVAADELSMSTAIPAAAIAKWRYETRLGQAVALDANTLILVDEAGMVGTRDMEAILTAAQKSRAKVVLLGDRRQLESVSGASALKAVSEIVQRGAVLLEARRQKIDWQRAASALMARGDSEAGVRAYTSRGHVEIVSGETAAQGRTVAIWAEQRASYGDDILIVTRRNNDCTALNKLTRDVLQKQGVVETVEHHLRALDREDKPVTLDLAVGDRVRFGETIPHLGIRNGNRAMVRQLGTDAKRQTLITFELEDGRTIQDSWPAFARERPNGKVLPPRIVHAYAGTVHSVQGRTAAATVLYVAKPTDARELYVAATRHTQDFRVVLERERLDAICRQKQADPRMMPTQTAVREVFFDEANRYSEKLNVADFVDNRPDFIRTGKILLPGENNKQSYIERALRAVSALQVLLGPLNERATTWIVVALASLRRRLMQNTDIKQEHSTRVREQIDRTFGHDR